MIEDQLEKLKSEYPDVTHWVRGNRCSTPDQWMPRKIDVSSKIAQLQPPASDPPIWRGLGGAGPRLRHLSVLCSGRSSHRQRAVWRAYCLQIQRAMRARSAATRQAGHWAAQCGHNSQTVIIIISVITIIIISDFCWSEQNSGFHGRRFILDIFLSSIVCQVCYLCPRWQILILRRLFRAEMFFVFSRKENSQRLEIQNVQYKFLN